MEINLYVICGFSNDVAREKWRKELSNVGKGNNVCWSDKNFYDNFRNSRALFG